MTVKLQSGCRIQRTTASLRNVYCGPGHIQGTYISAYLVFDIQLKVAPLLLEVSHQFYARYTANLVPNTAHSLQFTLCELWFLSYTMLLELRIFRVQYSSERICAAIGGISTIKRSLTANMVPNIAHILQFSLCELWPRLFTTYLQLRIYMLQYSMGRICAAIGDIRTFRSPLYCILGAKYGAHHSVCPMWTVVPDIYNVIAARIFRLQYSAVGNCAAIVDITTIQCALYCKLGAEYSARHPVYAMWTCGPAQIQCNNSTAYSGFNIQQKVCALLLEIYRQFNAPYNAIFVPNTAHVLQITLCELWSRTYTMYLQLQICRIQYSAERISAVIGDISTIQCALYSKHGAKYSAHSSVSLSELWYRRYTM
jgi:hypothetical protein